MQTYEAAVEYLRGVAQGRELMNGKQLEQVTGWNKKKQHDGREAGTLPFPYRQVGRLYYYTIYDVAEFLTNTPQNTPKPAAQAQSSTLKPVATGSRSTSADDFSHVFAFNTFLNKVSKEANLLNKLQQSLEQQQREQREEELTSKLSTKEEVRRVRQPI